MTEVWFYHLERARLEKVLPDLLTRTLERGWKAVVRVGSRERAEALDGHLWTFDDESFLPHGSEGEAHAERQPIYLTTGTEIPNAADVLFLVDGAVGDPDKLTAFTRCMTIFDGTDEEAVASARAFWKAVKAAGLDAAYWRQSAEGRWEKQA